MNKWDLTQFILALPEFPKSEERPFLLFVDGVSRFSGSTQLLRGELAPNISRETLGITPADYMLLILKIFALSWGCSYATFTLLAMI